MQSFSAKQRLHLEGWPLYERACFTMPHLIWKSVLLFLRSQMCLESAVLFSCLALLKDELWLL